MGNECTHVIIGDMDGRSRHQEKASMFRAEMMLGGK